MSIPYPARRNYPWLREGKTLSYTDARAMFVDMRRQAPEARNPARFRALTVMVDALDELQHRYGTDEFKPAKLHALLCAAATEAGWFTDPSTFRRKRKPIDEEGRMHCIACDGFFPPEDFLVPMSEREQSRNRKARYAPQKAKRDKLSHTCVSCRKVKMQERDAIAKEQAHKQMILRFRTLMRLQERYLFEVYGTQDQFESLRLGAKPESLAAGDARALSTVLLVVDEVLTQRELNRMHKQGLALRKKAHPEGNVPLRDQQLLADMYPYYLHMLATLRRDTRNAVNRTAPGAPFDNPAKHTYHTLMLAMVGKAKGKLDDMLDDGTLGELLRGQVHWTRLLAHDDIDTLEQAHAAMCAALDRGEKLTELITWRTLDAMAEEIRDRHALWRRRYERLAQEHRRQTLRAKHDSE